MEVICEHSNNCEFKEVCDHSMPHNIINKKGYGAANNCILIKNKFPCYCNSKIIRKEKLKKIHCKI